MRANEMKRMGITALLVLSNWTAFAQERRTGESTSPAPKSKETSPRQLTTGNVSLEILTQQSIVDHEQRARQEQTPATPQHAPEVKEVAKPKSQPKPERVDRKSARGDHSRPSARRPNGNGRANGAGGRGRRPK